MADTVFGEIAEAELKERFGAIAGALSPSQIQALATAQMEGTVSNSRLQELLGEHPADISKMLQRLCEEGYLVSDNKRRWASYRLPGQPTEPSLLGVLQEVGHSGDSIHRAPDSIHRAPDSIHSDGSAAIDGDSFVRTVAEPVARRRRVSPELMRQVILQLCGNRFLTLRQMAEVLHRNATAFRNQYLVPMVRQGLLSLRYPESPNRPDQAYTATKPKFSSPSTQDGDLAPKVP